MQTTRSGVGREGVTSQTKVGGANPNSPDGVREQQEDYQQDEMSAESQFEQNIANQLAKAEQDADYFTRNDQNLKNKDTVEVVVDILTRIKNASDQLNKQPEKERDRLYYLTFNATILIFRCCHKLREADFSKEATHFLAFNVLCLDNNLILTTAKYLEWRVLNYVELARAYADMTAYKAANKVVSYGIQKVLYLKQIEEQDPPVPDGTKETLVEALRVLRTQELKYQLQAGLLTADAWRKKLEETFSQNKYHKSLAIVECLSSNDPANCRLVQRSAKNITVKAQALKQSVDLVKADIELVKQALIQIHEKKKRDREKKDQLLNKEAEVNVDELLEKYKALDAEMIKEKDWKFASYNIPIEVHITLIKLCFECKMWAEFETLLDPALVRLKFRRYEVPYLATIDVLMSASKQPNIPNGFEKLPKDLNAANLRIELKKLRAQAKKDGGPIGAGSSSSSTNKTTSAAAAKEEEKKKEDAKKQPPAKPDPKGKKPDPKAQQQQQEIPKDEEDGGILASESELERIKHVYVNLLMQKTKNSQNAIVGVDIILADENNGPDLPDHHFAVAVPIRQHQGVYEKTKLIPYIVFRRTANALIDEEDSLSIVTDICVIQGQDPHLKAPLGYHKVPQDLRQTPKDLERVPNLDYVFLCYKTDKSLALIERDLLVFRRIADLEKSYVEKGTPDYKAYEETRQFLGLNYNVDMLVDLARTVKESLLGPLGDYYLENRVDILFDIACLLWSKYILPVLLRIETYIELKHQKEYNNEFVIQMDEQTLQLKVHFAEALNVMHRILTRVDFVEDIIMYSKFTIQLGNMLEESGDFRSAVQALRSTLSKVVEYREHLLKQHLDSKSNACTSMGITVDNKRIGELEHKIQTVYETWEGLILRKERDRERREQELPALDENEGDEEQLEVQKCIDELKNKDLFEKNINLDEWQKDRKQKQALTNKRYFSEQEQIVNSLHVDLLVNLYRCEIKLGKELTVIKNQTGKMLTQSGIDLAKHAPGSTTKNLSTSLNQKMNQHKNKSLAKSKKDLVDLKQTLQEAGKLPPPKPQIQNSEKILEKENNENPYLNALLHMCLAVSKSNIVEQKSLLLAAQDCLKQARTSEDQLSNLALENAVHIKASSCFHDYYGKTANQVHPFGLMSKQQYIKKTNTPSKPIMICRTSTSVTLKLPFYRPITEYKSWRNISKVALYGKPSGSGVGVSLNNIEYDGTGDKKDPGALVTVTGLMPNERYVFAAGGYTEDGICVNGIGETSNDIITLLPLSLHLLYGYLAEIAFKLGHYIIAKQAAEFLCSQFIEKNEFKYSPLDTRVNPILAFRLDYNYLKLISPQESKQLAEALIILAKVSKIVKGDAQKRADAGAELKVEKQKIEMKICNYLILALDISLIIQQPNLAKKIVSEIMVHLLPYMSINPRPQLLFHVILKCHQALRLVPQELIDSNTRQLIGCVSYQILKLGFEQNEDDLVRRVMVSELPLQTRKWSKYPQYVVRRPQLTEEMRAKKEDQERRLKLGEILPDSELIVEPQPFEERIVKVGEFEDEGRAYEEHLLSLLDYQDVVKAKVEKWKLQINKYQKQATNGNEVVQELKDGLVQIVEFWEGVKVNNPQVQLLQIITAFDAGGQNSRYLEFCCKCIRRSMELGLQSFSELGEILGVKIKLQDDEISQVEGKLQERLDYLEKDIVRHQRKRFAILEDKVQQMQDAKSMGGSSGPGAGAKTVNMKKLQELMKSSTQQDNLITEDNEYSQLGGLKTQTAKDIKEEAYQKLWISEKYFLQGMCLFLSFASTMPQRSQLGITKSSKESVPSNCVFNDILILDFNKFKQAFDEHNDKVKLHQIQFEEEHKTDNEKFQVPVEERVKKITAIVQILGKAAEFAKSSRSWIQLENIIRYTWNIFTYDLTTPLELKETEAWKYVLIIAESSLFLLEHLKNGGQLRNCEKQVVSKVTDSQPTLRQEGTKAVAFQIKEDEGENNQSSVDTQSSPSASNKGVKWFEALSGFDIVTHASFIAFAIQCLMGVKKWESLVDLSNRLNIATENTYAANLLPFVIYAQQTLHGEASLQTNEKRNALGIRTQQFENWKLTNKKKRSRQAMITGEIPPEEQEYLKDKSNFEKEIFRLEIIEGVLLSDKQASDQLFDNIKRDANNCEEALKQCRKLYLQYGIETQALRTDELRKGSTHFEIKSKKKGHKVFTSMVINNYKKCIESLRKRQEKFMLIQALHELGNLLYADGQLEETEVQWNDCIDTIFQKLYVVSQFRPVYKENPQLADSFGSQQCLIGGIVLTKLAKLCYEGKDLNRYTDCLLMAAELFAAPAKLSLPHPQVAFEYSNYKMRNYLDGKLFEDKQITSPSELLNCLGQASQALIDQDLYEKALPLTSLMEFLASDISKSKLLTVKARILKAISLSEIGYINEAFQLYNRVLSLKDLPKTGSRISDFTDKKDGKNYFFPINQKYYNNFPPEHEKNQEAINSILKVIPPDVLASLKKFCSPYIVELLQYLRSLMIARIGESENVEAPEKADFRLQIIKNSEDSLRLILRNLQVVEEVYYLQGKLELLTTKEIDIPEIEIQDLKGRISRAFDANTIIEEDQKNYYTNREEEMCYADRRSQIIALMLRARSVIARILQKQGFLLQAFYVLKQSLNNFKQLAEGKHYKVENGAEADDKGSFKLPDAYGGPPSQGTDNKGAQGGAAAKKAPSNPPPQDKKNAKGNAQQLQQDEELLKKQEEQSKLREIEQENLERQRAEQAEKRDHPHMHLWLRTKVEIINILMHQKRFEDCADAIAITKLECKSVNDQQFLRMLQEVEFFMSIQRGEIENALRLGQDIRKTAKNYFQQDVSYGNFLGNYSELLYKYGQKADTIEVIKEGRLIMWYKLRDYGLELDQLNINLDNPSKVNKSRIKPTEDVLAQYQSQIPAAGAKGGAQAKAQPAAGAKGAAAGGKQAVAIPDDLPTEEEKAEPVLDFSKKIEYPLQAADSMINSSQQDVNIYLKLLENTIKFDIRYAQYLSLVENKQDLAKKILIDSEKLVKRVLHVSPQIKFYVHFLLGFTSLQIFYEKVTEFQQEFSNKPKYQNGFSQHIPYGSIAQGQYIIDLPNFSENLKKLYQEFLQAAKRSFKQSIDIGKVESIVYEFDINLVDALRLMSETCYLISEYRQRVLHYKYIKYSELDRKRKVQKKKELKLETDSQIDDSLLEEEVAKERDEWEEQKLNKEKLEIANNKRQAIFYLEASVNTSKILREFIDKQHTLSTVNLTDPSKVPREVVSEVFEVFQVTKVNYIKVPDFDPKDKLTITSAEILSYMKQVAKELELITFGEEKARLGKLLSKLHRYLKINLASYVQKCLPDIKEPEDFKDANAADTAELTQRSKITSKWLDLQGQKNQLFYILGPMDEAILNSAYPKDTDDQFNQDTAQIKDRLRQDALTVHFGRIDIDPLLLSALYQDVRDLIDNMKASEKQPAQFNERDRKGYRVRFNHLIERLGNFFKAPLSNIKQLFLQLNVIIVKEEDLEKDVDCLALVEDILPDLTVDTVEKLAVLLQKETGFSILDPKYNVVLKRFHRVRYIL